MTCGIEEDARQFRPRRINVGQVQLRAGPVDWTKADHLVSEAKKLWLKLFLIMGYHMRRLAGAYCRGLIARASGRTG